MTGPATLGSDWSDQSLPEVGTHWLPKKIGRRIGRETAGGELNTAEQSDDETGSATNRTPDLQHGMVNRIK